MKRGWALGSNFGIVGMVFSPLHCLSERLRGRTDIWNAGIAGMAAGGAMGMLRHFHGGPLRMARGFATGGVGFALMALAMEKWVVPLMGGHG